MAYKKRKNQRVKKIKKRGQPPKEATSPRLFFLGDCPQQPKWKAALRIFYSFLIIVCSAILILLPVSQGVYDFRTDPRTDNFSVTTAPTSTNSTVQLLKPLYDTDLSTISISSTEITDAPYYVSYNGTSRALLVAGLTDDTTRMLSVEYDVNVASGAISKFLDILPWIWIIIWVAFPIAGLVAIWTGKAD